MFSSTVILAVAALFSACQADPTVAPIGFCDTSPQAAVSMMVDAHGGRDAWQALASIYVEREHLFAGAENPIRFNIHGEYPSHRIYQEWLAQQDATELTSKGCSGTLPGHGDRRFLVVDAAYEPDPVRKPGWYEGARDHCELYIDADSHRLSGVMQHWTYAGRLDTEQITPDDTSSYVRKQP